MSVWWSLVRDGLNRSVSAGPPEVAIINVLDNDFPMLSSSSIKVAQSPHCKEQRHEEPLRGRKRGEKEGPSHAPMSVHRELQLRCLGGTVGGGEL